MQVTPFYCHPVSLSFLTVMSALPEYLHQFGLYLSLCFFSHCVSVFDLNVSLSD